MLKTLTFGLLVSSFLVSISIADSGFPRCDCNEEEGFWNTENILVCQRMGDFLIAVAYFSIPLELLYFASCSNIPFKWLLFQFIAFIVLCGMTHLLNGWTYGPHSFQLMLAVTTFKFFTAVVSIATSIALVSLIPLLLQVKVREVMLQKKARDLGQEVGMIRRQREAGRHVRMLTREIRKSLDRHTILYTTLVELSKTLDLQNCAVWMPNENKTEMNLIHELKEGNYVSIPYCNVDVRAIKASDGVKILGPDSALAAGSRGGSMDSGPVAAIRMPMLSVSNFKVGTPEMIQACYAILVLVLPSDQGRCWSNPELEIVKVVADQVAVAVSHATLLEESQFMREQLAEQNFSLQQARQDEMMASKARESFENVMSNGLRRPLHSILGLFLMMRDEGENLNNQQHILVDAMVKTSNVVLMLINDMMDISTRDSGRFRLDTRPFYLHSMVKDAACLGKCLCVCRGYDFVLEVDKSLHDHVTGDDRRVFQVILHLFGNLLNGNNGAGHVMFRVHSDIGSQERRNQRWATQRTSSSDGRTDVKFEIGIKRYSNQKIEKDLSFSVCKKLIQLMHGDIWVVQNSDGFDEIVEFILPFQPCQSIVIGISESGDSSKHPRNSLLRGLQVLVADDDVVSRVVTKKLLRKLGCVVSIVASGRDCLGAFGSNVSTFHVLILHLQMPELDGFAASMRIWKIRSRSWPLIIALTDGADEDETERCLQAGMNGVIRKPVTLRGITDEIQRVLMQQGNKVR